MAKQTKNLIKLRESTEQSKRTNKFLKKQLGYLYGKNIATLTPEQSKLARCLLLDAASTGPLSPESRDEIRALHRKL